MLRSPRSARAPCINAPRSERSPFSLISKAPRIFLLSGHRWAKRRQRRKEEEEEWSRELGCWREGESSAPRPLVGFHIDQLPSLLPAGLTMFDAESDRYTRLGAPPPDCSSTSAARGAKIASDINFNPKIQGYIYSFYVS